MARIVLGVAGGIAAYKACSLLRLFTEAGHDVTVVPTESALRFVGAPTWEALSRQAPCRRGVWDSVHEVPHVRIGQSADLVVVAPATADLVAKAAHGLAGDLLTNVLLTARCPVVVAPAMHTEMWDHPATQANVSTLMERGVHVIPPASGRLTGADTGPGRLPEPADLYAVCERILAHGIPVPAHDKYPARATPVDAPTWTPAEQSVPPRAGWRGAPSSSPPGGTREPLDPVRFLGNRSSGKQGYALAAVAARRGAQVVLVSANAELADAAPASSVVPVSTALELQAAVDGGSRGTPTSSSWQRPWPTSGPPTTRAPRSRSRTTRPTPTPPRSSSWCATPTCSPGSSSARGDEASPGHRRVRRGDRRRGGQRARPRPSQARPQGLRPAGRQRGRDRQDLRPRRQHDPHPAAGVEPRRRRRSRRPRTRSRLRCGTPCSRSC